MLSARRTSVLPDGAAPPAGDPSQSSAAARKARTISSSGSGLSAGSSPASGGVTAWPTPTTTGVRGSRAMEGAAYRLTPRGLPGAPVDSVPMRVAVGSDHAGFDLKEILTAELAARGHEVADHGTYEPGASADHPDDCVAMAANKVPGIRAAVVHRELVHPTLAHHTAVEGTP